MMQPMLWTQKGGAVLEMNNGERVIRHQRKGEQSKEQTRTELLQGRKLSKEGGTSIPRSADDPRRKSLNIQIFTQWKNVQNKAHLQMNAQGREPIQRQRNKHNLLRLQCQKPLHILHISAVASCRRGILKRSSCLACSLSREQGRLCMCVQVGSYFGTRKQAIYSIPV